MKKVSIVVPVYNVEAYLNKCLDSLVMQTLEDIEIIIINDGSTDKSESVAKKYVEKYKGKVRYYKKKNGGLSDARNYGMKYATGEYIAFLDSDDYVELTLYEKMYNKAKEKDYDMVECNFYWQYDTKKNKDIGKMYDNQKDMMVEARVIAWNKLYKRKLVEDSKVKFPKGLRYEDVEFFYKLIPLIKKIGFVKEPLIYYIQREDSISNTQNEKVRDIFQILDNVIDFYEKNKLYRTFYDELEYNYMRYLLGSSFLRIIKIEDKLLRNEILEETWEKLNSKYPMWNKNLVLIKRAKKNRKDKYFLKMTKFKFKLYSKLFRKIKK